MVGIYKITSLNNKIYVGQSIDILKRKNEYLKGYCKNQIKLYNSILKYGWENHKFEIITLCYSEQLNELERDFQEAYNVIGINGLNCKLTKTDDRSGKLSEETKLKIGNSNRGKKHSNEYCENIKKRMTGKNHPNYGKKLSTETKLKISIHNTGKIISNESKLKMRNAKLNKILSEEHKNNISKNTFSRRVINIETGIIYNSCKEAAILNNIKVTTLNNKLLGYRKNNTSFKYIDNGETT